MRIDEIGTPCGSSPRLLRVPAPIASPSLFCPKAAREHAEGEERHAYSHEAVGGGQIVGSVSPQSCHGKQESAAEKAVGEHIYRDMWHEPQALQGGHERAVVYLGMNDVYDDEHRRHDKREQRDEPIVPTIIAPTINAKKTIISGSIKVLILLI